MKFCFWARRLSRCAVAGALLFLGLGSSVAHATIIGVGQASNYAVLGFNNLTVHTENDPTTINGNLGLSAGDFGNLNKGILNGDLYVDTTATFTLGNAFVHNGSTFTNQNLAPAVSDAIAASAADALLTPTQTFGALTANTTITGNGGENIISVASINLQNKTFSLVGGANDFFLFNVTGDLLISSGTFSIGSVPANHILFNVLGNGSSNGGISVDLLNGGLTATGTFLARNGNIFVDHATVNGALIGGNTGVDGISLQSAATINYVPFVPPPGVPEPASFVLLGLGGLGALYLRRMKR